MKNSADPLRQDQICIFNAQFRLLIHGGWLGVWLTLFYTSFQPVLAQAPPANFSTAVIGSGWNQPVGLTFSPDGNIMFVWEKGGKVWTVIGGIKSASPLLDISPEVGNFGDHGLIGFAVAPNFNNSGGAIYLLYAVDRHYLLYFGTSAYNPAANEYLNATIGRITRYTVQRSGNTLSLNPATRAILLGETKSTGFPILHDSHGVGSLAFGSDGTLMVTTGDGASFNGVDVGPGTVGVDYYSSADSLAYTRTYAKQALLDGIITPQENVGAFRAQMLTALGGKMLRLDPATGNGVPSNPFYDAANPRSARSRIWDLGLRNAYRMTRRPDTGSPNASNGNPGVFYLGDVGFAVWEELNIAHAPGLNFGWPLFEGLEPGDYAWRTNLNPNAPNPLYNGGSCAVPFFRFKDLLKQPLKSGWPVFNNICNAGQSIPSQYTFVHARPAMDWKHGSGPARVGTFTGNTASVINVGATGSPVTGAPFSGNASTGGVWYTGNDFPAQYKNTYFHADYGAGWLRNLQLDGGDNLLNVRNFIDSGLSIVCLATNPVQGGLYYINYSKVPLVQEVRMIYYSNNRPPQAVAQANPTYGPGPLTVQFNGSSSSDAESAITYAWNFGDGSAISTAPNPSHVFNAVAGVPTKYTVTLTVRDNAGATSVATLAISVNNTPPTVHITSPINNTLYPLASPTMHNLTAQVTDNEQSSSGLSYQWQTILHHNNHEHPEPYDNSITTTTEISPLGCDGETYYYRIVLTVTDAAGLSATDEVRLYPNCGSTSSCNNTGTISREVWTNVDGNTVATIPVNMAPSSSSQLTLFETPSNSGNNYGQRLRGYICPPTSGNYVFWIASDDEGELWLSTTASPANKQRIAYIQAGFAYPQQWTKYTTQQSALVSLQAGQQYYIEALHKQRTGGDNLAVGWQLPNGTLERPIPGNRLSSYTNASNAAPTVNLTAPTNAATFPAGSTITLTANAADSDGSITKVEFFRDATSLGIDNAAPYSVAFSNASAGNYALKAVATDNQGTATNSAIVNITVGNTSTTCNNTGTISREVWTNVDGNTVATIPVNMAPSSSSQLTLFETPSNSGNNYGQRLRGYICPPTSGNYVFWIASDDEGELWLSTTASPANKQRIAYIQAGFAYPQQWTKYTTQQSALVSLQAGQQYYIEALHKQRTGGDNLAVGWQLPNGTLERPIPGNRLMPFGANGTRMAVEAEMTKVDTTLPSLSAYPNPFSHQVTITFTSDHTGEAMLELHDLRGVPLRQIYQGETTAGEAMEVEMDGRTLPEGMHIVQLKTGAKIIHYKIILVR
ncbi:MAG: PA14 domain-containing protein [Bacteroidota bacterium]